MRFIITEKQLNGVNERVISRILSMLESGKITMPYFKNLDQIGLTDEMIKTALEKFTNGIVVINKDEYYPSSNITDKNGGFIYQEDSEGNWSKWKYDERGEVIYQEDSEGEWRKWEYDERGNRTHYGNSNGDWENWEYNERDKQTYRENSRGYWEKKEFDKNGNKTYEEDVYGYWRKWEYDKSNNLIYYGDSNGIIKDKR